MRKRNSLPDTIKTLLPTTQVYGGTSMWSVMTEEGLHSGEKAAVETSFKLQMMGRECRLDRAKEAYDTLVKEIECLVNALKEFVE